MDQLNNRFLLRPTAHTVTGASSTIPMVDPTDIPNLKDVSQRVVRIDRDDDDENDVYNMTTRVNKLTRRKLHTTDAWSEWQQSEWLQLDRYDEQHMFGDPVPNPGREKVFNLVWTYVEKVLDGRKKARCTLDGSARNGNVRVLDHTYANCVDQTGARIFYAASRSRGSSSSEPTLRMHLVRRPAETGCLHPPGHSLSGMVARTQGDSYPGRLRHPVCRAMQGHPESPRLWKRHIDRILREELGFAPRPTNRVYIAASSKANASSSAASGRLCLCSSNTTHL